MGRALKVCPTAGCPNLVNGSGRCPHCQSKADQLRGTRHERGYGHRHERFRRKVLLKDPRCVCTDPAHGHASPCQALSTVADHHPLDRRELMRLGLDPDDPSRGRGLCEPCHNRHTAAEQPGGWNTR